ncbi:unnamed protein product [Schistosoma curassoni]|uniref:Uncharacterized protein n=1 Tax=Schistosoma curassoni TaxID=6186 RepID=A0A183KJJ2_9TREM|nr:unnamed protein product [Schistosoma curassoni]
MSHLTLPHGFPSPEINNRPLYLQSDLICELTHKLNGPIINVNCQETSITQQQWFPLFSINTLTLNVNMQINLTEETEYNGEFIKCKLNLCLFLNIIYFLYSFMTNI